ncbi:MAG: nitric oxide synthase oxygenase [Bacteroidota bacterium]
MQRAQAFLTECYHELGMSDLLFERLQEVEMEIKSTGIYTHTIKELSHGCRMAWRNSNRCIGRLYWKSLKVVDARDLSEPDHVFDALQNHIDLAFNKGEIFSVITVFNPNPGFEIMNHQLIRFAGYENGKGDPAETEFTNYCSDHGWQSRQTNFDVLPWVIRKNDGSVFMKAPEMQSGMIVSITHPEYEWFNEFGLQWYAVPAISDMILEIGGVAYPVAPFNGWYMGTEIGSRNFGDADRYNMLPPIAQKLGLDVHSTDTMWKDRALVELNRAVISSFRKAGVAIENHHDASEQFMQFMSLEQEHGRDPQADWTWVVPPMSSSVSPVFHLELDNNVRGPNFFYRDRPSGLTPKKNKGKCPFHFGSLK